MATEIGDVEVLFFDAAGTLFRVRGSVGAIYSRMALRHGAVVEAGVLNRRFEESFRRQPRPRTTGPAGDLAAEKRWWFDVVARVFEGRMSEESFAPFFEEVFEFFRGSEAWELYPDTLPCLEALRGRGYRLALLSNFDSRLDDVIEALGLGTFFEAVILSWRVGAMKPEAGIFQAGLRAMRVKAERALHVGDSPWDDADGARNAGIRPVLLDRDDTRATAGVRWRIRSLNELPDRLPDRSNS